MEQETCFVCEDCGREHDESRVVDIRKMVGAHYGPPHWKLTCSICKQVAIGPDKNFCYTQTEYKIEAQQRAKRAKLAKNT